MFNDNDLFKDKMFKFMSYTNIIGGNEEQN